MYKKDIDSLLNKGKHFVCNYVTAECYEQDSSNNNSLDESNYQEKHLSEHNHHRINKVIDHLFDFRQDYSPEELVEWVKYLICGRRLPITFAKDVKQYDTTSKCTLVWTYNFIAYRCRTCAMSLCMSLCADCFHNGDHMGHDFNMFRSQAGGACDCGDPFVMKPSGFCQKHQPKTELESGKQRPPNSLLCIANEIVPKLLHYLVLYLRESDCASNKKANALVNEILIYLCDLGTLMQTIICKSLIDSDSYTNCLKSVNKDDDLSYQHRLKTLENNYKKAVQEIELSTILSTYCGDAENIEISDLDVVKKIESFKPGLKHRTYLDEIIFWTIINEFPSDLITFLLKMLPNEEYKRHFAECFVKHYFRISMLIFYPTERFSQTADKDIYHNKLANAVVHISVQLFSNENLARDLCEKSNLLYIIILSLKFGICGNKKNFWGILKINSELGFHDNDKQELCHYVVPCDHPILRYYRFWPLGCDLNNLFAHKQVAFMFFNDNDLINIWFEFIMSFQAMNLNLKSTKADDTNQNYKYSYLAELDIGSSLWTLISHLNDEESRPLTVNFINHSLKWLKKWLLSISFEMSRLDVDRCTFHLPLHRNYSVFMNHAVSTQDAVLEDLLPKDPEELKSVMAHPLQTLICSYQIMANMWFSFGPHIKTQALNYMQPSFCNSTIDADLFLVQQIASHIDPDEFVQIFFRTYGLEENLYLTPLPPTETDQNKLIMFLENGFGLFAIIVGIQMNLCLQSNEVTRKEIVSLLSVSDKTHSQIRDMMPYRWEFLQNDAFIEILNDIAEYKSPEVEFSGSLVQGYFYPKNDVWRDEYDPLFFLYRNAQRKEFQASLERFAAYARQSGKYESNSLPWPPFRVPPQIDPKFIDPRVILNSKTLHAYFFAILHQSINEINSITQHLMSIVIHLIELTLIESCQRNLKNNYSGLTKLELDDEPKLIRQVNEFEFSTWYPSDDILVNFITFIETADLSLSNKDCESEFDMKVTDKKIISIKTLMDAFMLDINDNEYQEFLNDCPIITAFNEDENVSESDPEDSSFPAGALFNPENLALMIALNSLAREETPDSIRENKQLDSLLHPDSTDDSSSQESQPSCSKQSCEKPKRKIRIIKFNIELNQSILTMLLRLHSNLSEKRDSFKTDSQSLEKYDFQDRIGDGPYFIGCLLKRFIYCCADRLQAQSEKPVDHQSCLEKVIEFVNKTRQTIWPEMAIWPGIAETNSPIPSSSDVVMSDDVDLEEIQRSEKRRKALERKQQIMNKFCLLQDEFLKKNKSTFEKFSEDSSEVKPSNMAFENQDEQTESDGSQESAIKYQPKTYQCVICRDFGTSILERPFVQVVLLQSSSILNNTFAYTVYDEFTNKKFSPEMLHKFTTIPLTDEDYCSFKERKTFAYYFEHKVDRLLNSFALESWLSSFNIGWCGGVHAQSCGHFMHMDCYQSYISSVYQNRDSNDLIEYSCPLCRKIANSVLPIIPNLPDFPLVQSRKNDPLGVAIEILNLLSNCDETRPANTTENDSRFLKVLAMAIEDVMKATEPQYRNIRVKPCPQSLFLFLSSISRTNLEYNIVLWRKKLPLNENASCLVPLFHALSLNAKLVLPMYYMKLWVQITGVGSEETGSDIMPYEKQVPLLIKDVSAILLQFLYALPFNIDKAYFLSIIQALLNLNFIQAIVMITFLFTYEEKMEIKNRFLSKQENKFQSYLDYIGFIINGFDVTILGSSVIEVQNRKKLTKKSIFELLAKVCLPFLRISSMIYHLLFDQSTMPEKSSDALEEFSTLATYLGLKSGNDSPMTIAPCRFISDDLENELELDDMFFNSYINWIKNPSTLIHTWYIELDKLMQANTIAALSLIQESCVISSTPKLLRLPKVYEQLFMFYHKRRCETCNNIPKDPSLCLICGRLICIRESCCRTDSIAEGVMHARKCGAGTALYLAINSSTIILIRGRKACAWGSVYLDKFGEEDQNLKRGKPLYLCEDRYRILEQQWLTHSFLNINKKWVYHKDSL